jgi:primosomal replication protein N
MAGEWKENQGILRGIVAGEPEFSHENHGEDYYRLTLLVARLSGVEDRLPVVVSRSLLEECPLGRGDQVEAQGEMRSHNNRTGVGSKLQIFLFARQIAITGEGPKNQLRLTGSLCRSPVYRRTPLGREICDLLLAVSRRYGGADYLPCIAWGSLARYCREKTVGARISFTGRLQSRAYRKVVAGEEETRTALEISIMELEGEETDSAADLQIL